VTALAAEAAIAAVPARRSEARLGIAGRLFEPSGSTLEDAILGAWEDLGLDGRAACPVCAGELRPDGCADCGSALS
jgi:hypothetical protein